MGTIVMGRFQGFFWYFSLLNISTIDQVKYTPPDFSPKSS